MSNKKIEKVNEIKLKIVKDRKLEDTLKSKNLDYKKVSIKFLNNLKVEKKEEVKTDDIFKE